MRISLPSIWIVLASFTGCVSRVAMKPKATQFTLTFMRPHSLASVLVMPTRPALAAE
ncbi:hypothetical protein D9M68_901850 [compost metagenome]